VTLEPLKISRTPSSPPTTVYLGVNLILPPESVSWRKALHGLLSNQKKKIGPFKKFEFSPLLFTPHYGIFGGELNIFS
jgi:hypothetical protein